MFKKMFLMAFCALGVLSLPQSVPAQNSPSESATQLVCEQWLALLDQGAYGQSWDTASSYFKSMVTKEQWTSQVTAIRSSLGDVISRNFSSEAPSTSLPGAPDGQYVITTYSTVFKNKASAIETVVLMKDKDGQWRLAGYFIR